MPPQLPFDVVAHIIGFLQRDKLTLVQCSLVCHHFHTIARPLIVPWEEATLSPSERCLETPDVKHFLDDMTAHPERAATYDQLTLTYSSEVPGRGPPPAPLALVTEMIMTLCERLPEVRALKLDSFEFDEPALYALFTVAGRIHTLEYLYLDTLELPHQSPPWPHASVESWSASEGGSSRWALRKLFLNSGMIPTAELQSLVSFLEQSRESIPLESLELCTSLLQYSPDIVDNRPGAPYSLGLRHYGNTVNDISRKGKVYKPGRENMSRLLSDLGRCRTLRSVRLDYDAAIYTFLEAFDRRGRPRVPFRLPAHFVKALARTLNPGWGWGAPPLPALERLQLVVHAPHDWLAGWKGAFASLAKALVGDAHKPREKRRYPRFARLQVRSVLVPYMAFGGAMLGSTGEEEIQLQMNARKEDLLLPMLEPFVKAGVQVDIAID